MEGSIINVREIVERKKVKLRTKIEELNDSGIIPKLALILANNEDSSRSYIKSKRKLCEELGVKEEEYVFESTVTTKDIITLINNLNNDDSVTGILVQLPLFDSLDEKLILNSIDPQKDVDGFHPLNLGKLLVGEDTIIPCTPKGIIGIIDELGIDLQGKEAVVVGRSKIVGKPIAQLLLSKGATVTICHSKTKDLSMHTKMADLLVVATGVPNLVTADMVKEDSIVIDVGINRVDGKIVGDVDTINVSKKCKYITPVPGGIGLTTVLSLLENLVQMASLYNN